MSISQVTEVFQAAMVAALKLAAPILIISLGIGLIISIFQAATQIHEQTLSFVPKLFAIVLILVILGPWMMQTMNDFVFYIFSLVQKLN